MNPGSPKEKTAHVLERHPPSHSHDHKPRRAMDAAGLALFHLAVCGLVAWSAPKSATMMLVFGIASLIMDVTYFFSPPKHKARQDPEPEPASPNQTASVGSFALELLLLVAPPIAFITWLLFLVWQRQILTQTELMIIVIAMPAIVGLVSWIIKVRMTRCHVGIVNQTTKFIGYSMLGTWIGSTFFFLIFLVGFLVKTFLP